MNSLISIFHCNHELYCNYNLQLFCFFFIFFLVFLNNLIFHLFKALSFCLSSIYCGPAFYKSKLFTLIKIP